MKLAIFDMDGTLFDTSVVNYLSYKKALNHFGYDISKDYYCTHCNGKYFMDFLPQISTSNQIILNQIHNMKKEVYCEFLSQSIPNNHLFEIIELIRTNYKIALVTSASYKNTMDILNYFKKNELFDLIITHEDVSQKKPSPEGFLLAMQKFNASPSETIVFEDSEVGFLAARDAGIQLFKVAPFASIL